MRDNSDLLTVANTILHHHNLQATSCKPLQSLWAGYGHICELKAKPLKGDGHRTSQSLILKHVDPPHASKTTQNEGHFRKVISYQVEQHFYTHLAPSVPEGAALAKCLTSLQEQVDDNKSIAMIITDLRPKFPEKRGTLSRNQVYASLRWLATFHGFWWKRRDELRKHRLRLPPLEEAKLPESTTGPCEGVWLNGGYTYLATRLKEYEDLKMDTESEWSQTLCEPVAESHKTVAELVAQVLAPSPSTNAQNPISEYETLIHGDVKSENLFSSKDGHTVAFYDFQYVGLGLGVCDLAKLFTVSVPLDLLTKADPTTVEQLSMGEGEKELLEAYQRTLEQESKRSYPWDDLEMHWNTALVDWLRFQASWGFWGNTEWLEARVRCILDDQRYMAWLIQTAEQAANER